MFFFYPQNFPKGQNLIELALTFPLLLVVILGIVEVGRAWNTFESARLAAIDGTYTASVYHNVAMGNAQINSRLDNAGLEEDATCNNGVQEDTTTGSYESTVCIIFRPIFSDLTIQFMGDEYSIFPDPIPIKYEDVRSTSIY